MLGGCGEQASAEDALSVCICLSEAAQTLRGKEKTDGRTAFCGCVFWSIHQRTPDSSQSLSDMCLESFPSMTTDQTTNIYRTPILRTAPY